jgi:hypothetical protein
MMDKEKAGKNIPDRKQMYYCKEILNLPTKL